MSGHGSEELGVLASLTAAIEATRTEITDISIEMTDSVCRGHILLTIPVSDVERLNEARVTTEQARVIESGLEIDLDIEIDIGGLESTDGSPLAPQQESSDMSDFNTDQTRGKSENRQPTRSRDGAEETMNQAEKNQAEDVTNDRTSDTDTERERERARYRDPEELAAVYDEDSTFKEMKADLGVDVTAQTVRKYMIKYGIHDPEPRPDRMLESIRASEFDLMSGAEDEQSNRTGSLHESDSNAE